MIGTFDVSKVRAEFPVLDQQINGSPLVFLDSGASSQQPTCVIDAVSRYAEQDHANVHRGVHTLSRRATTAFEASREAVAAFVGAANSSEIVFTRGATEAINLVANTWGQRLQQGDVLVLTEMEHHANIVPWQRLAQQLGLEIRWIPFDERGELDMEAYAAALDTRVRLVGVVQVSNALGTVNPVREMVDMAHAVGAKVLVDGAQGVVHGYASVADLGCDFYVFSAHKMYAPTGVGVLWAPGELLSSMPPWQGGGEMIREVHLEGSTYADPPARFEAGTPNISGAVGLHAAIEAIGRWGREQMSQHEAVVLAHGERILDAIPHVRRIGHAAQRAGVISFVVEGAHPQDVGVLLDKHGVAVRTGHHCAQPALRRLGLSATIRASVAAYSTVEDMDRLGEALERSMRLLR